MNILHILEDYSIHSGGLRTVVKDLNERLNTIDGINSFIISSKKEKGDSIEVINGANNPWLYSREWKNLIEKTHKEKNIDIIHIHGVWMFPQYIGAKFAIESNTPFLLSVHGMYEPWIWAKGTLKKKIYFKALAKKVFSRASTIHSITANESKSIKEIFNESKIVEIPNLINHETYNMEDTVLFDEKYILYLGRLNPVKGIDLLINAFAEANLTGVILKIAGPINVYKEYLEKLTKDLRIDNKVEFLGLVKGEEKSRLYRNAFVFVAPSHTEVIGMVNLEAAICNTPVITTHQTGLKKSWSNNGGRLINPNKKELVASLKEVFLWTDKERNKNGKMLCNFVINQYSWKNNLENWEATYKNLLKN